MKDIKDIFESSWIEPGSIQLDLEPSTLLARSKISSRSRAEHGILSSRARHIIEPSRTRF